jgi:hypothetical protein
VRWNARSIHWMTPKTTATIQGSEEQSTNESCFEFGTHICGGTSRESPEFLGDFSRQRHTTQKETRVGGHSRCCVNNSNLILRAAG